jgi:hypothetical protein
MVRLRESQWILLLSELERSATGATIHNIRIKYAKAKNRVEAWCEWKSSPNTQWRDNSLMCEEQCTKWLNEAAEQLKEYGYDDVTLFIEEVDDLQ